MKNVYWIKQPLNNIILWIAVQESPWREIMEIMEYFQYVQLKVDLGILTSYKLATTILKSLLNNEWTSDKIYYYEESNNVGYKVDKSV